MLQPRRDLGTRLYPGAYALRWGHGIGRLRAQGGSLGNGLAVLRLVYHRALGHWKLLTTVFVGILVATAMLASVVIYSDAIRDLGLSYALRQQSDQQLDVRVFSSSQSFAPELYDERKANTDRIMREQVGDVTGEIIHYGKSDTFFPTEVGGEVDSEDSLRPRANFQFIDGLRDRVDVVEGGELAPPRIEDGIPYVPVWVGAETALLHDLGVGDVLDLHPFWLREPHPVRIEIVGVIEPRDRDDRDWYDLTSRFVVNTTSWPTYPFWADEDTLVDSLIGYLPNMNGTFETYAVVDRGAITSKNAEEVEARALALSLRIRDTVSRSSVDTTLAPTIANYRDKLFFTRLPLFALMLQIAGIVAYYLVMVSGMLVDRQQGEIALLRSRGASPRQVLGIYALEGGILCTIGLFAGPFIAATIIGLLGYTPAFNDLSGGSLLDVTISPLAFYFAAIGAGMSMAALLIPAYQATKKSMIHYKQNLARPPQQPVFLRYYLDLAVVGVAGYAFYQLQSRGSAVTERLFGGLSADPLLLAAPTLFMLMVALVFLRVFPLVLGAASWLGRGLRGATIPLGLWHMVRTPTHYSRLILLLLLATAVGMFAAGFRATLERSYDDRAAYEAGAPVRVSSINSREGLDSDAFRQRMEGILGAETISPVARVSGSFQVSLFQYQNFEVLGVEPDELPEIAFWRNDFAGQSLESLLDDLPLDAETPEATGPVIPPGNQWLGVWGRPGYPGNTGQLGIRLLDSDGTFWEYRMVPITERDEEGWQYFVTDLDRPFPSRDGTAPNQAADITIDAIYVRIAGIPSLPVGMSMTLDDFTVSSNPPTEENPILDGVVVEDFEALDSYVEITGTSQLNKPGTLARIEGQRPGGDGEFVASQQFVFEPGGAAVFGFRVVRANEVLPVVASRSFLDATGLSVGSESVVFLNRQYVTIRVVDDFSYFPTWEPSPSRHLMVADLSAMRDVASRVPFYSEPVQPTEAWATAVDPTRLDPDYLQGEGLSYGGIFVEEEIRAEAASDPLVAASWEGILFISFSAVLLLTALGFVVYSYLSAQTRQLEFAILRTMGFTGKQILGLVSFEQVFVIVAGVAVGTFLGLPLGRLMIGYLGVTETGQDILPPLVSSISWQAIVTVYGLLSVVFIATVVALATLYSRLAVHRALRMGEL